MNGNSTTEQLFWARELVKLAREQATLKGVSDHVMAQAMLVQAWMLFTGQSEEESKKSIQGLFAASLGKHFAGATGSDQPAAGQGSA
jgi:hypothetical protein